ncbi:MAG: hypothetical protein IKX61_05240 [Prevotella sp.]|nr:hypothetical protein [Prevotella sp.]
MKLKLTILALALCLSASAKVKVEKGSVSPQTEYAASLLRSLDGKYTITLRVADVAPAEGFTIEKNGKKITITGNDGPGVIYGVNRLKEYYLMNRSFEGLTTITETPEMVLRGACVGLQKTVYLPGHRVYEYPYTPENFPWFYDKELWIKYLDMLAADNMNTVYLWNGHPFASLVKLDDYPFAPEVDDATMQKNQEMFSFLVDEADRRGIRVIQMFYNIILSKPFADHYGLKTQDRNRPITPLISDYTRKSIAAFVQKYPKVGFLVCLGEAMATIDDDVQWMKETIIPGIKDGLKASGRTDEPPIILRSHDTDGPLVLKESLPLYPNIYTMSKYTGESLTTYEPGGPWGETHRQLAAAAPVHIDNVHILANLEPWRWSSPAFTQKAVQAMHNVHHSKGLHLYPQASYWDWPYTADKLADGSRQLQIDRDWMWYKAWGRYAWNSNRGDDKDYWIQQLAVYYGIKHDAARQILEAYDESGEIAPKLLRRFGITEGNRQTLLLGMKMSELVNPYKYTVYPGFYESCGPQGEKLIEYVEKEWKEQAHEGELPLDIVNQCVAHGEKALAAISSVNGVARHSHEFLRLQNDMRCYDLFARSFRAKVLAAQQVLNYKWSKNVEYLEAAVPLLEMSLDNWRKLAAVTADTYLYANSMQTSQRRIPVGGDNGNFKTWTDMLPVYEEELEALKQNIAQLKFPKKAAVISNSIAARPAKVRLMSPTQTVPLTEGAVLFENREDTQVDTLAHELKNLQALVLNRDSTRIVGTTVEFECDEPVQLLVGFFQDDDNKWARPPKLEIDATGNEYGQAEPVLTNAIALKQMPPCNIHAYHLQAGHHKLNLPRGIIMVAGFTSDNIKPRDAALKGASDEVDWLFIK